MNSLINLEGSEKIAIKLLEMIEKTVGWVISPKGERRDFLEGQKIFIKEIESNPNLNSLEKAA